MYAEGGPRTTEELRRKVKRRTRLLGNQQLKSLKQLDMAYLKKGGKKLFIYLFIYLKI